MLYGYDRTRHISNGDVPPGLSGASSVMLHSELAMYLIGGHGYMGKVNTVYRLNVRSGRWLRIAELEPQQNFSPRDKFAAWDYHDMFVNVALFCFVVILMLEF